MSGTARRLKRGHLSRLISKLKLSFVLSLAGSWGLAFLRFDWPFFDQAFFLNPKNSFYLDLALISLCFLGLLLAVYYSVKLRPRVQRIDELGENMW